MLKIEAERRTSLTHDGLVKLGWQKPRQSKPKMALVARACDRCMDWHSGSCKSFQAKKAIRDGR